MGDYSLDMGGNRIRPDYNDYYNTINPYTAPYAGEPEGDNEHLLALLEFRPWWHKYAQCRGMAYTEPDLFFPERGVTSTAAKALCAICPVRQQCDEHATKYVEHGVWGGKSERQRRQANRGNPRRKSRDLNRGVRLRDKYRMAANERKKPA